MRYAFSSKKPYADDNAQPSKDGPAAGWAGERTFTRREVTLSFMNRTAARPQQGKEESVLNLPMRRLVDRNALLVLAAVGAAATLLCMPFFYAIYYPGDEGILLNAADRLLAGQRLYTDIFEMLPPGGFILTEEWLRVFGISMEAARSLTVVTIMGIACFIYLGCRQASGRTLLSALLAIGWVVMSQGSWTQLSYHYFATLFAMIACWATLAGVANGERSRYMAWIAGLAAGAAAMMMQNWGALALFAGIIGFARGRGSRAAVLACILGSAVVPALFLAYLAAQGTLAAWFQDAIAFPTTRYAQTQGVPFGLFTSYQGLPLKYLFPFTGLLTLAVCARDWHSCLHDRLLHTCIAFGLAGFFGCFPRPDIAHIGWGVPVALPLFAYGIKHMMADRPRLRYAALAVAVALCMPSALAYGRNALQAQQFKLVSTPRGRVAFVNLYNWEDGVAALVARIAAMPHQNAVFFYPYMPLLPFLTAHLQVSKYDLFLPGFTLPSQYEDACRSMMRRASWIVVEKKWEDPGFMKTIFPAERQLEPRERVRFEQALEQNFPVVAKYGSFQVRHRAKVVDRKACDGIEDGNRQVSPSG